MERVSTYPVYPLDGAEYLARCAGDPSRLMKFAREGRLSKNVLANLLRSDSRRTYLDACAAIERNLTERCIAKGEYCLEGGCAMEGDVCLDAVLKAGPEYFEACGAEWLRIFVNPDNRIDAWRV